MSSPVPLNVAQAKEIADCEKLPKPSRDKCYEPIIAKMNADERGPVTGWIYIVILLLLGLGGLVGAVVYYKKKN